MKKVCVVVVLAVLTGLPAYAQYEYPRAVGFLGYSFNSVDGLAERQNANGFLADGAFNFHKNVGIAGNFGGQFRSTGRTAKIQEAYQYLVGPRFYARGYRTTAFAHALFGGMKLTGGGPDNGTGFAMGFGGGLEIDAGNRFSVRAFQVDYIPRRFDDRWGHNIRVGVGLVIR